MFLHHVLNFVYDNDMIKFIDSHRDRLPMGEYFCPWRVSRSFSRTLISLALQGVTA